MRTSKIVGLLWLAALVWLTTGSPVHAASPVIKDFSSEGGQTSNKDNAKDTMYLVKPADKITFKVKADGAGKYEWLVNKAGQKVKGNTFTWTAPNEKGIWEIHLTASSKDEAAHQEWVVSTLAKSEAPVLFEYFCPDRSQKDPWDRPLPKWDKEINRPDYILHRTAAAIPSKTAYGTWVWYRKLGPKGKRGSFSWRLSRGANTFYNIVKPLKSGIWDTRGIPSDYGPIGVHCIGRRAMGECCSGWWDDVDDWHEVRIVRTKDGWFWMWVGGQFWYQFLANENTVKEVDSLRFWGMSLDGVRVYDRPVWPEKSIRFGEYRDDVQPADGKIRYAVKRKGIIIDGHGVTPADIAKAIGDPKLFRYDPATGTAVCYTDLVVKAGAELVINGETLKMHCEKNGEHQIRVGNCSTIRLNRATVTSDNKYYYLWAFNSACKWEDYPNDRGGGKQYASYFFSGRFLATDSTISNCANLFIDTPGELVLKRCKLIDLVEVDAGNYWKIPRNTGGVWYDTTKRMAAKGKKGLWFYNRKELTDFRIEDCIIGGKDKPIDITFIGGDDLHKVTISNCDLDNVAAKKGYRFRDWRDLFAQETEYMSCTVSLLNCKFKKLKPQSSKAWIMPKYYLDVLAVDKAGKPIPGCEVRVINEVNDVRYPPENLLRKRYWVSHSVTNNEWIKYWLDVNDLRAAVPMGDDGHSVLPPYKTNTLVLTDFIQGQESRQEFTYTVQVTAPGGRYGQVKGVNPGPDWYRKDPNKPTKTIKVVVAKVARPAKPTKKARPTVKTAKSPWPGFLGPDYAHTGRSPYTAPAKCRLMWRYKTNGEILVSSPVIGADGTIYVSSRMPDKRLHAINPDGSRKWVFRAAIRNPVALATDGTIFAGVARGSRGKALLALNPEGKLIAEYNRPYKGQQICPIVGPDGTLYYAAGYRADYSVWAFSPDGKKTKWTFETKRAGQLKCWYGPDVSSPAFGPDGTVYIGGGHNFNALFALNPDGKLKWSYKTTERVLSSPAVSVADKTVYVGCREGRAWRENVRGHLLAVGFDGSLKWDFKVPNEITASPAIGQDGTVYVGSRDGYFYALDKNGKEKWKFKTGDVINSSAAIDAKGRIYFGSHDHYFYCLSPKGKLLWKYLTGGSVVSSPAIGAAGEIYVGSADGYLYAFGK